MMVYRLDFFLLCLSFLLFQYPTSFHISQMQDTCFKILSILFRRNKVNKV